MLDYFIPTNGAALSLDQSFFWINLFATENDYHSHKVE